MGKSTALRFVPTLLSRVPCAQPSSFDLVEFLTKDRYFTLTLFFLYSILSFGLIFCSLVNLKVGSKKTTKTMMSLHFEFKLL